MINSEKSGVKRIAILCYYYPVAYSPTILNTALFWARKGYFVDILIDRFVFEEIEIQHPGIRVVYCTSLKPLLKVNKVGEQAFSFSVKQNQAVWKKWISHFTVYWFLFKTIVLNWIVAVLKYRSGVAAFFNKHEYSLCIAFEPEAVMVASYLHNKYKFPYYYHSLELYSADTFKNRMKRRFEQKSLSNSLFSVIQDPSRSQFFCDDLKIGSESVRICPVAAMGPSIDQKSAYLYKKFNISNQKKIVLYLGAFYPGAYVEEIALSTNRSDWDNDWVLVLHGFSSAQDLVDNIFAQTKRDKVIVSLDSLNQSELDQLVASADVSIALYKSLDANMETTVLSSGKIAQSAKCSVPVILSRNKYTQSFMDEYNCGLCIDSVDDLNCSINEIISKLPVYRKNMQHAFIKNYDFESKYLHIAEELENFL